MLIDDHNFGALKYQEGWGWCSKNFYWKEFQNISICIDPEWVKSGTVSEICVDFINLVRSSEASIVSRALEKTNCYEIINNIFLTSGGCEISDVDGFLEHASLDYVFLDSEEGCELQYITGGPLLRIFIDKNLEVNDVYFDGMF